MVSVKTFIAAALCWAGMALAQPSGDASMFRHVHFTLELPKGWARAKWVPDGGSARFVRTDVESVGAAASEVHFADAEGNFFSVYLDSGTEMETDAVWTIKAGADGSSIRVEEEGRSCKQTAGSEGPCSAGNGSLEIVTMPTLELRAHGYAFRFGNTRREDGVSLAPFRQILASFRAL